MTLDFLKDKRFLNELDSLHVKQQFVRLTVLSWTEQTICEIQGKAISGSLTLDGGSSVRRTASFTMFAEEQQNDLTNIDQDLSINRKVKLEIGFRNTVPTYIYDTKDELTDIITHHYVNYKEKYGDIVWFPLGIYVIFDPNISHQTGQGVTISISLRDKMCLLNGDAGGTIPASVIFSEREDSSGVITQPTIRQIIQEAVVHFGMEDNAKVIIEDLDDRIKQVMKYIGGNPIYYLSVQNDAQYFFLNYTDAVEAARSAGFTDPEGAIVTYQYGQDVGFLLTDFTYPGDLTCSPGDTVTSVLDQIVSVLGNYEYFYDAQGYFHFREIKNYLNTTYTTTVLNDVNQDPTYEVDFSSGKSQYTFEGTKLINAITNAPSYSNVKNDFMVWGVRTAADGETEIPIRYHLAVDEKPEIGQQHLVRFYQDEYGITRAGSDFWFTYDSRDEFPQTGSADTLYIVGDLETGQYWRWDDTTDYPIEGSEETTHYYEITHDDWSVVTTKDWREELYYQGVEAEDTGSDKPYYFTQLISQWPKLFNLKTQEFYDSVRQDPSSIDFWLDLIDDTAAVGLYSVQNIGRRGVVVQQDQINCVFQQEVPDVVFISLDQTAEEIKAQRDQCDNRGQAWMQVDSNIWSLLATGGTQNSCYERIRDLLYQYTNMAQSITISALPIYYLEPNTLITVRDDAAGISGDFLISSISLPLDVDGTMSITAYEALQKI